MQDFQEEILKKNIERKLSIQKSVETEFSKAYSTVEDAIERGVLPEFILQKGKELPIGTEKQWGQNRYIKTLKGWKLVSKEGKHYQEGGEKEEKKEEETQKDKAIKQGFKEVKNRATKGWDVYSKDVKSTGSGKMFLVFSKEGKLLGQDQVVEQAEQEAYKKIKDTSEKK